MEYMFASSDVIECTIENNFEASIIIYFLVK